MGPYCKFCGMRCFTHLPAETPKEIQDAYGTSTIVATCRAGQAFEKQEVGYCYDDIQRAIAAAKETEQEQEQKTKSASNLGGEILAIVAFYGNEIHPRVKQALLDAVDASRYAIQGQDLLMTQDPAIDQNKKVIEVRYPNPFFPSIIVTVAVMNEGQQITRDERVSIMTKLSEAIDQINAFSKESEG